MGVGIWPGILRTTTGESENGAICQNTHASLFIYLLYIIAAGRSVGRSESSRARFNYVLPAFVVIDRPIDDVRGTVFGIFRSCKMP